MIITAASENHAHCLFGLLRTVPEPVIVYDLGLSRRSLDTLRDEFKITPRAYLGPDWHSVERNAGEYAWKPAILYEIGQTHDRFIWLDAGDLVEGSLDVIHRILDKWGFYSPASSGTVADWTHPSLLQRLRVGASVRARANRNGAIIAFNLRHSAGRAIWRRWTHLCRRKSVIAPPGSSRSNHRQDQAVLSVVAAQVEEAGLVRLVDEQISLSIHND